MSNEYRVCEKRIEKGGTISLPDDSIVLESELEKYKHLSEEKYKQVQTIRYLEPVNDHE